MLDPSPSQKIDRVRPKVVLIEDEPELRRSLQLLLQGRGFAVRAYASAQALLNDPSVQDADCLVSDYRMPELDGLELMERLRVRGFCAPAVLITAFPSTALTSRATETGFSEVLTKPFLDKSLVAVITRLVAE